MMLGLKIAAACFVLFITGGLIHAATKENRADYKLPSFLGVLGLFGIVGVPLGLILAIFGV